MSVLELQSRGLLELLDVELARALVRASGDAGPEVELAVALASRSVRRGHSCFPMELSAAQLWRAAAVIPDVLPDAGKWTHALRQSRLTQDGPMVLDQAGRLYLRRYWALERDIAVELAARSAAPTPTRTDAGQLEASVERLFPGPTGSLQRAAAKNALRHRVSLLCGGPGTGKTTTVAAIVALLVESRLQNAGDAPAVLLLAPTGKSAARLSEAVIRAKARVDAPAEVLDAIPEQAQTIHRSLGMQREGMRFRRSADFPLEADVIVVDEASMVDLGLMRQLLDATPPNATLLIVGDPDQLTSVEAGSVLRDLVRASEQTWWSGRVTRLTKTYRYEADQALGQLVAAIREGDPNTVGRLLVEGGSDLVWAPLGALSAELDRTMAHWSELVHEDTPARHFELRSRFVMLSPYRVGPVGTRALGAAVVERLEAASPRGLPVTPIMIEENSHELGVFNGDFAMLIDGTPRTACVQRDSDELPKVAEARLPRHSDAFALTVHKSQGSEFDEVLVLFPQEDAPLLTRELLYTAVSRAKKRVRLVGPKEVVMAALRRKAERYSGLVDAIAEVEHVSLRKD